MKITRIERASKNKAHYHLYSDDLLLMTITEETLLQFQLQKGTELSDDLLDKISEFDQIQRCLEQAYRYLSRRNHFQKELIRKLHTKGYKAEVIEKAMQHLQGKGYLNDAGLMVQFIHDAIHLKHYGPHLIKRKLIERGLESSEIEQTLAAHYAEELQHKICAQLAVKKLKTLKKTEQAKKQQKLISFLQQRGFTWEIIRQVVEENLNLIK